MIVAFFLHLPFFPTHLSELLRLALLGNTGDYDDPDAQAIIPIDLDLLAEAPNAEAKAGAAPAPSDTAAEPSKKPVGEDGATIDAGPAPAASVDRDAGPHDAGPRNPTPAASASASASSAVDAGAPPLRDPVGAAGGAGKVAAKDPNVQVFIASNVIRKHELGAAFGRLLVLIPEWHQFFEGSPIDPIRDLNHLLITAPRFRGDSSKMVAIMDFNIPEAQIRAAVDLMVQRTQGEWLAETAVPTAHAKVLAGDRLFAIVPGKKMLVVLPMDAKDQIAGLKKTTGFRNGTVGIVISMLTPGRPFKGFFSVPDTLKWLRLAVTPTGDGGADVALESGDKSPEDAAQHAGELTKAVDKVRTIDLVLTRYDVIDHMEFVAEGDVIKARVHVTAGQLKLVMNRAEGLLQAQTAKLAAAAAASATPSVARSAAPSAAPVAPAAPTGVPSAAPKAGH